MASGIQKPFGNVVWRVHLLFKLKVPAVDGIAVEKGFAFGRIYNKSSFLSSWYVLYCSIPKCRKADFTTFINLNCH